MDKVLLAFIPLYILFILCLGMIMFRRRLRAVKAGAIPVQYFKAYGGEVPEDLKVLQNHFSNQFEVPVLFFVTCLAAVQMGAVREVTLTLALIFFVSRVVHSFIHLGHNKPLNRARAYFVGVIVLVIMWIQILLFA